MTTYNVKIFTREYGVELHVSDSICFLCGEPFNSTTHKKTKHHSIPKFLKPKFNVVVPIGKSCHHEMNKIFEPKLLYHKNSVKMLMDSLTKNHLKVMNKVKKIHDNIDTEVKK